MSDWLRRLFSSAPLPTWEAVTLIVTGITGWALAIAEVRPDWAPAWTGLILVGLSIALIVRGVVGIAATAGAFVRSVIRPRGWPGNRAPRTEEENAQVVERRPFGWEYLYFAGVLWVERARLDTAYYDHELRYARPTGVTLPSDLDVVKAFIHERMEEALAIISSIMTVMASDAQERAFGEDGVEGDPGRIHQLAVRWNTAYADFLDWAARLRGTGKPDLYRNLFEAIARMSDAPIGQYRDFVTRFVEAADGIPAAGKSKTPLAIQLALTLEMDLDAQAIVDEELAKLQEALDQGLDEDYEPPSITMTQREEREGIIRDARQHRNMFRLMGKLNNIQNTALDVRDDYRERVTELRERRHQYIAKYGPSATRGDFEPVDMTGPMWLQDLVNDLHRIVWQMGEN